MIASCLVSCGPRGFVFVQISMSFLSDGHVISIGPLVFLVSADYVE